MNRIILQDIDSILFRVGIEQFRRLEGKTVLITGPQGLLASYLVETIMLLNKHYFSVPCQVIGLSRSPVTPTSRLGYLLGDIHFRCLPTPIFSPLILDRWTVDFIIHAAGRSAPQVFTDDPVGTIEVNIALIGLLEKARAEHAEVLYFSSSEIYGTPTEIPTPETYWGSTDSLGPRSCYTEAKRCGEALCMAYYRQYQVPVKIVRPAIVYGPGLALDDKRVIAEFIKTARQHLPIHMRDAGEALRSYCYITDAITVIWQILLGDDTIGEVFNVGNARDEVTIAQLARMVHELVGVNHDIELGQQPLTSAPSRVCVSMEKCKQFFGFEPMIPLRYGLARTIEWMTT